MAPESSDATAGGTERGRSIRSRLLVPLVLTPILLLPLYGRPVEPWAAALGCAVGLLVGVGLGAVLDRYRSRLEQWNDGLVVVAFVGPTIAFLFAMQFLTSADIVGYQALGLIGMLWGTVLQDLVRRNSS